MASTYSTSLRLELMATGDQSGTWGDTTNTNLGTLLEQAITGVLSVAQGDTTLTLTSTDGASDQARNAVVNLTGAMTAIRNVVVPTANKLYTIKNSTTGGFSVVVKTTSGTGVSVPPGASIDVYCDGTNVVSGADYWSGQTGGQVYLDAGATAGPVHDLFRDSTSPATNDILGQVLFNGRDSAGNKQEYGSIQAVIADATSGSEDSAVDHYAMVGGVRTRIIAVGPNLDLAAVGQIKFPATANPSLDANTLDDYEEGTWTPTITPDSGTITSTNVGQAQYAKIGRLVTVTVQFTITNAGSGSGLMTITMPFTSAVYTGMAGREYNSVGFGLAGTLPAGSTGLRFGKYDNTGLIVTGYGFGFSCTYMV